MSDKFAYFIPTYGKANNIPTLNLLRHYNVTDFIYLVVGEDDPQLDEYIKLYTNKDNVILLIFNKCDYYDKVDSLGAYNETHKVCTYARAFIDEYAIAHHIKYICFMFDDIESVQLRFIKDDNKIYSTKQFDFIATIDAYLDLLKSSESIGLVGPPSASYYIGINVEKSKTPATHYGNMFIYDVEKQIGPYKASVLEDMTIVLQNNIRGRICLCPFGLQVNCRAPMVTTDCYKGINRSEYVQHHVIMTNGTPMNYEKLSIPYKNFTPKIVSSKYRKD